MRLILFIEKSPNKKHPSIADVFFERIHFFNVLQRYVRVHPFWVHHVHVLQLADVLSLRVIHPGVQPQREYLCVHRVRALLFSPLEHEQVLREDVFPPYVYELLGQSVHDPRWHGDHLF